MTNEVVTTETPATNLMDVIKSAALNPNTNVANIQAMFEMYRQIEMQRREDAFNRDMMLAQKEMPQIFRDKKNEHKNYRYSTLQELNSRAVPIYTQHGFALSFGTLDGAPAGHYRMTCKVSHRDGFSRDYMADLPSDMLGDKGNPNKTAIQGFGSSMSYGRRYMTMLIFNMSTTDEDDDGEGGAQTGPQGVISIEQRDTLAKIIEENGFPIDQFLKWAGVETLADIPAASYQKAFNALQAKVKAKAGK